MREHNWRAALAELTRRLPVFADTAGHWLPHPVEHDGAVHTHAGDRYAVLIVAGDHTGPVANAFTGRPLKPEVLATVAFQPMTRLGEIRLSALATAVGPFDPAWLAGQNCLGCGGDGRHTCPACEQEADCPKCEGTGRVSVRPSEEGRFVRIGGGAFAARRLAAVLDLVPDGPVTVEQSRDAKAARLSGTGWLILLSATSDPPPDAEFIPLTL